MVYHPQALANGREALSNNPEMSAIPAAAPKPTSTPAPASTSAKAHHAHRAHQTHQEHQEHQARGPKGRGGRAAAQRERSAGAPRASLYDEVTARIVGELEAGRVTWVQPWDAAAFAPGLPRNGDSGRSYSGINILILWSEAAARGFAAQRWLTFRQALAAGGAVRRGEKGTTIFYAARFTPKGGEGDGGASAPGAGSAAGEANSGDIGGEASGAGERGVPFLKRFTVFNVDQCEGLPPRCLEADAPLPPRETVPVAEALLGASGADIRIGGNQAYYSPSGDYIALPPQQAFPAQIDFYRTALHEAGHWSGHPSRLDRDQSGAFGSAAYGREELCAELASAFLCAALGIKPTVRHADYIGAWLAIMRADTRAIFKAASLASKAADYLIAFVPEAERAARGADAAGEGQ
jgi:antirestriction protein ArdC